MNTLINSLKQLFPFLIIVLISSCQSTYRISNSNIAYLYKKDATMLHPQYLVFHSDDSISQIHFEINSNELLYSRKEDEQNFRANILIAYKLYPSYESMEIIDSSSTLLTDITEQQSSKNIVGFFNIKAKWSHQYLLEITTTDLNRNIRANQFISINKFTPFSNQNFLLKSNETKLPLFRNNIKENEEIIITYPHLNKKQLTFSHYKQKFPMTPPPFSIYNAIPLNLKPDSIFSVTMNDSNEVTVQLDNQGFYLIKADTTTIDGCTLFCFDDEYPLVQSTEALIEPLRYLTTNYEFTEIITSENQKQAVDKFWLNNAGNPDRARELIKHFYNRVQDANEYFTSYVEGWKTDRGMVYVIYGPPNIIFRTSYNESWIYGEENNLMSLTFNFVKLENTFTDNDFFLNRAPMYKSSWYRIIDSWRQGRIYISN